MWQEKMRIKKFQNTMNVDDSLVFPGDASLKDGVGPGEMRVLAHARRDEDIGVQ